MRAEWKPFFGHRWRTVTRPRILKRDHYRCVRCKRHRLEVRLEVAHLVVMPGEPGHDADENLATMCVSCHKAHDYKAWAARCRETRAARKDAGRPILQMLEVTNAEIHG